MNKQRWNFLLWAGLFVIVFLAVIWVLHIPVARLTGEYVDQDENGSTEEVKDCRYCEHYLYIDFLSEEWHQIPPWFYDLSDEEKAEIFEDYIPEIEEKLKRQDPQND